MKKRLKIILIILVITIVLIGIYWTANLSSATISGVVVKVENNNLLIMNIDGSKELYGVGTREEDVEFKQGQEVLIYFDGTILTTYPAQIGNVRKIKIVKEKSDITIPENILRYCYSSKDNVTVTINEFTKTSVSIIVEDTNEIPYKYTNNYIIYKKVKNEDYTGIGEQIGENTENSTAGYTRDRDRIHMERNRKKS